MKNITHTYQLLVLRNQFSPIEVKATCAEEACQIVKRSFMGHFSGRKDFGMIELGSMRDFQNTWLVMRTTPFEYCQFLHIESWDGERFRSFGKGELGEDIITAVRNCAPEYIIQPGMQDYAFSAHENA